MIDHADDLDLAIRLARAACEVALPHFHAGVDVETKPDGSPVTVADRAAEAAVAELLAAERPDDGLLGEEDGLRPGTSGRTWVVDPIDGTGSFTKGVPLWGPLVALDDGGDVVVGVAARPVAGDVWFASRGGGTHRGRLDGSVEPVRLRCSTRSALTEAVVTCWPIGSPMLRTLQEQAGWEEPDMMSTLRLLAGEVDVVVVHAGGPWDHAAPLLLVEEAGGSFRDPEGGRRYDLGGGTYTNGCLDAALAALREVS